MQPIYSETPTQPKLTIRYRSRQGVLPGQGYCTWYEYQLCDGHRVIGRFDFEDQAIKARDEALTKPGGR